MRMFAACACFVAGLEQLFPTCRNMQPGFVMKEAVAAKKEGYSLLEKKERRTSKETGDSCVRKCIKDLRRPK